MVISNVNFNLYKSFIAVYEAKNISRAAERLQITQPTVTYNIKELERQLNVKLFHTHPRGVEPTKDAHELYKFVAEGMLSISNGESAIKDFNETSVVVLKLAVASGPAQKYVADAVAAFSAKYPNVRFEITDAWTDEGAGKVAGHSADLVVGLVDPEGASFTTIELKPAPRIAIAGEAYAKEHNLDGKLTKEQLDSLSAIIFHQTSKFYGKFLTKDAFAAVANFDMMASLVGKNMGIGLCLEEHLDGIDMKGMVRLDVSALNMPDCSIKCIYNRESVGKAVRMFMSELCGVFGVKFEA